MSELEPLLTTSFLVGVLAAGVRLAVPILLAALGEIVTERAGVLNLGLEGIMLAGALAGFMATSWAEHELPGAPQAAPWLGLGAGMLAGLAMGLVMAVLSVSLRTDQVVAGIMLVALGYGATAYIYREAFGSLTARIAPMGPVPLPGLAELPVIGPVLFAQDPATYSAWPSWPACGSSCSERPGGWRSARWASIRPPPTPPASTSRAPATPPCWWAGRSPASAARC